MGIFDSIKKEIFPAEEAPIPNTLEDMVRSSKSPESGRARVIVVEPMRMEECNALVECIRHGLVVLINAERLEQEFARRIIDFLTGATRAIDGRSLRINQTTYIFAPSDVDVATRRKEPAKKEASKPEEPAKAAEQTPVHQVIPDEAANTVTDGLKKDENFASFREEESEPVAEAAVEPAKAEPEVSRTTPEEHSASPEITPVYSDESVMYDRKESSYGDTIVYGENSQNWR